MHKKTYEGRRYVNYDRYISYIHTWYSQYMKKYPWDLLYFNGKLQFYEKNRQKWKWKFWVLDPYILKWFRHRIKKKKSTKKFFWAEKWLKISTGCQNQKNNFLKTFRVIFFFFWWIFFWFYGGITWGCRGQTLKIFILIFVCFFHKIVICR